MPRMIPKEELVLFHIPVSSSKHSSNYYTLQNMKQTHSIPSHYQETQLPIDFYSYVELVFLQKQ